jgi:hypothetical protein
VKLNTRNALVAATLGAVLVYVVALLLSAPPPPAVWHATILLAGALVGLADLLLLSLIARIRGR